MKTQRSTNWHSQTLLSSLATALAAVWLVFTGASALGQSPVISSFSQNGELVCTNLVPGTAASVEWASSVTGPWTNNWAGLDALTVDSNGMIRVSVPMFYRVRVVAGGTNLPPNMVLIPAGSFTMGDTFGDGWTDERPTHTVYVSAFFYMDPHEVTKAFWDAVKTWNGGNGYSYDNTGLGKAANHPVHRVNWYDAVKWCNARSQREGLTPCYYTDAGLTTIYKTGQVSPYVKWNANGYRLPTEAEREKAARGGASGRRFPWSHTDNITHSLANYWSNSGYPYDTSPTQEFHPAFATGGYPYTSPAGYFAPNGYGLYDMAGNVSEWCWDWYQSNWYSQAGATQNDTRGPVGPLNYRVLRGGNWDDSAYDARCAHRDYCDPVIAYNHIGFRCVRGL